MSYPSGTEHIFCYAYYVTPPPTSGTIIIRKEVSDPARRRPELPVRRESHLQRRRSLRPERPGRQPRESDLLPRGDGHGREPWTVRELVPPGWNLVNLVCESPGASTEVVNQATASAAIYLAAGDTVTCTYTDEFRVPAGQFYLAKITLGGTGIFDFRVFPVGGGEEQTARAETRRPDRAGARAARSAEARAGSLPRRGGLPDSRRGTWDVFRVWCGGRQLGSTGAAGARERGREDP